MKVTLNEAKEIRGKDYEAGDEVLVNKELGARMIEDGVANRLIAENDLIENRTIRTHCGHKKFGR